MASVAGSAVVIKVDKGVVCITPGVTGCVLGADVEERILLVGDVNTVVLMGGEMLDSPESHASVGAPEKVIRRSVVGLGVVSPVNVAAEVGEGGWPAAVTAEGGGSADVGALSVVVGAGVDSAVAWSVWVMGGADDTLSVCEDPALLENMEEESEDVTGTLVSGAPAVFPVPSVFGRAVTILEVVG